MFAVTPYRAEFEDHATGTWKPCRVIGATMKAGEAAYVVETDGPLACLLVVDYIRFPAPRPWQASHHRAPLLGAHPPRPRDG